MTTTVKKTVASKSVTAITATPFQSEVTPTSAATAVAPKVTPKARAKPAVKKPAVSAKAPAKPAVNPKAEKPAKVKKPKLVRDSFTIPKAEFTVLDDLKQRAGLLEVSVKKSELLRAGIKALAAMSNAGFLAALKVVPTIKTGRPTKD